MRILLWFLISLAAFALVAGITLTVLRKQDDRRVAAQWEALAAERGSGAFELSAIAELPEPARRYLAHAIAPGTPLARSVELTFTGELKLSPDLPWTAFDAQQVLAPARGYVWKLDLYSDGARFRGAETLLDGKGQQSYWLREFLPSSEDGATVDRSLAGRSAIDLVFLPSALLPGGAAAARWSAASADRARAEVLVAGQSFALDLELGPEGQLLAVATRRLGNRTPDGTFADLAYGARVLGENTFGGYTVPAHLRYAWHFGEPSAEDYLAPDLAGAVFH